MKKLVQILEIKEMKPLLVMNFVFEELTEGFKSFGFEKKVITDINDLVDDGIIFIDDSVSKHKSINFIIDNYKNIIFICWYWQNHFDLYSKIKYFIPTGQNFLKIPQHCSQSKFLYNTYHKLPRYVPLLLRANEDPELIGTYERKVVRDYCYMGCEYKRSWVPTNFKGIYHTGGWDKYLNYDERKKIYLSSTFALGFQSDANIDCNHLSQRLFEGLAYGCIVLCENQFAEEYTDGIIVYIKSKEDLVNKMSYFLNNPALIDEKQKKGYEWVKKYGTNRFSANLYLDKIEEFFNINIH
jgi:spore maturation protein CgeB